MRWDFYWAWIERCELEWWCALKSDKTPTLSNESVSVTKTKRLVAYRVTHKHTHTQFSRQIVCFQSLCGCVFISQNSQPTYPLYLWFRLRLNFLYQMWDRTWCNARNNVLRFLFLVLLLICFGVAFIYSKNKKTKESTCRFSVGFGFQF